MALKSIPLHRSANRVNLFMGGDRELVMFTGMLCAILIFAAMDVRAATFGIISWVFCLWLFRLMAKSDPMLRYVYLRHRRYKQKYYPARSTPFRRNSGKMYR